MPVAPPDADLVDKFFFSSAIYTSTLIQDTYSKAGHSPLGHSTVFGTHHVKTFRQCKNTIRNGVDRASSVESGFEPGTLNTLSLGHCRNYFYKAHYS
ncbi:hypothetical protein AVEN_162099-1 [Araneus ventricosus]|uniref:Uncharacterized protein n=1 Tax=Araneus ventricosus TaxID=182803 RepID=A0A4Y2LLD0_ARAVE|nr:hypothetical protein AVEN_162099-1 [Araneus ventricosus]